MSIGYGAYSNAEYGFGFDTGFNFGPPGCDPSRANTCGTVATDGTSTCYDDQGCPIYKEGDGKLTVLAKKGTEVGKEFLDDRLKMAKESGETLTVDFFGKETVIGGMTTTQKLMFGGVALVAIIAVIVLLNK